jgi:hypothetical protein
MTQEFDTRLRALERAVRELAFDAEKHDVVAAIPDPDAAPEPTPAAPATRWWVVDRWAGAYCNNGGNGYTEAQARARAHKWDEERPLLSPHLAIEAENAVAAVAEYRRRVGGGDDVAALREQVATLTRERDDARVELGGMSKIAADYAAERRAAAAEVARLRALAGEAARVFALETTWHGEEATAMYARLVAAARGEVANG